MKIFFNNFAPDAGVIRIFKLDYLIFL